MKPHLVLSRFVPFGHLTRPDIDELISLAGPMRTVPKGRTFQREGDRAPSTYLLHDGWTATSVSPRRAEPQLIKIHVPGDVIGMPSIAFEEACTSLHALTDVTMSALDLPAFGRLFERSPRLAAMLFLISQEERSKLMDRFAAARLDASGRIAALVIQLRDRLQKSDPAVTSAFAAPLTQTQIGDLTGLTSVHVNRTLMQLKERKLLSWSRGAVEILDEAGLRWEAGLSQRKLLREPGWLPASKSSTAAVS